MPITQQFIDELLAGAIAAERNDNTRFSLSPSIAIDVLQLARRAAPALPYPLPVLERPLVLFDLETTGTEVTSDRIWQIAGQVIEPTGPGRTFNWLVNPQRPLPPVVQELTGMTDARLADCPTFRELVATTDVWELFQGCDLGGYNQVNFDVPLLWEEFHRVGRTWNLADVKQVDVAVLFKLFERRRLADAVAKYAGPAAAAEFAEQAHEAQADIARTLDVFRRMRSAHPEVNVGLAELDRLSTETEHDGVKGRRLDLAGVLIRGTDGVVRFSHKKVRGVPLAADPGYARWILGADFSANTKQVVRDELRRLQEAERASQEQGAGGGRGDAETRSGERGA
jgi:DNA polymerase III subunit epsilon